MYVLVDYDNIEAVDRGRGLPYLALRVLDAIGARHFTDGDRAIFRLYGGWHQGNTMSQRAQLLSAEAQREFPTVLALGAGNTVARIRVTVDLALSMIIDPQTVLLNTYRRRAGVSHLGSRPLPWAGCIHPVNCPVSAVHTFLASSRCPAPACAVEPNAVLERPEQKLVDTMFTADLIKLSSQERRLAVVSSDDDMWPGIKTALISGAAVVHVHPKAGRVTPTVYSRSAGNSYQQCTF
jgi:hypothetical protein